ncbi:hypothetical protein E3U43_016984 [Larimichthys crocea]|uniref:Uncharacterized protein n=1 Tax=Larimichthys crocea TaxID=215358 RepID=A0ACD3QXS3_LARCR|nr:hypothetical protein E3U43_016984 [Larimichthys crocea]
MDEVEAGSDAPSESKVDQRVTLPAENGLSHTLIITPKPPAAGRPPAPVCRLIETIGKD